MRTTPRVAGFRSEYPAGFELECMAGFIGIRKVPPMRDASHGCDGLNPLQFQYMH
ncbi:hypothetical protein IVB20_39135 [Bradyrhizobium sp. 188]|nr:hypothetical protein [Bradyrhizobium sp. 188]